MPPDRPEILLRKARQDELVLERLLDDREVDDDTLGFHAQQAVEKLLKAVLASRGVGYPRTHNLRILIELLTKDGIHLPEHLSHIARLTHLEPLSATTRSSLSLKANGQSGSIRFGAYGRLRSR